jgi:Phosphodiester glycosidase
MARCFQAAATRRTTPGRSPAWAGAGASSSSRWTAAAPATGVGATLRESALVMRALGAREAVNLDGGGSTTMVVRGRVVNRPSDPGGERAVSDGLFVLP